MENKEQLTVLVTGFGPFGIHKVNASWEAVKLLPELFSKWEKSANVNLIIKEIPVAYNDVSCKVKELWEQYKPSIIIHVGVSKMAQCLTIECQANSKGYSRPDIFNHCPQENDIDHVTLKTKCDTKKICEIINKNSNETDCKACISTDAGRYLCEYIYYQSLNIKEPYVIFIHVPDLDVYPSIKSAQGIFNILTHLIECAMDENCVNKI